MNMLLSAARAATALVVIFFASAAGADVPISTCAQTVTNDTAVLTRNLDCGSSVSITLENASLALGGFTLRGARIDCEGYCAVTGPGTHHGMILENGGGTRPGRFVLDSFVNIGAVLAAGASQIVLRDMEVDGGGATTGCLVDANKVIMAGTTVSGGFGGVCAPKGLRMFDSRVSGNSGDGLTIFGRVNIFGSTIDNNAGSGVVSAYGTPYRPGRLRIHQSMILGNGLDGVAYADLFVRVTDSTISGNRRSGMRVTSCDPSLSTGVRDSVISGNAIAPGCGTTVLCADIDSCARPRVTTTECETSHVAGSGIPGKSWGACSQDAP